jgi:hypothetical protein
MPAQLPECLFIQQAGAAGLEQEQVQVLQETVAQAGLL